MKFQIHCVIVLTVHHIHLLNKKKNIIQNVKFVWSRNSSSKSISRMENDLKMVEENTSKFENQLNVSIDVLEKYIKNWELLRQEKHNIYQIGSFNFSLMHYRWYNIVT